MPKVPFIDISCSNVIECVVNKIELKSLIRNGTYVFSEAKNLIRKLARSADTCKKKNTISHWICTTMEYRQSEQQYEKWKHTVSILCFVYFVYLSYHCVHTTASFEMDMGLFCQQCIFNFSFIFSSLHLLMVVNLAINCIQFS